MTTSSPIPAPNPTPKPGYEAPAIVHKTQLKQFSGSPLVTDPNAGSNLLGLPQ